MPAGLPLVKALTETTHATGADSKVTLMAFGKVHGAVARSSPDAQFHGSAQATLAFW
jgi:hypothetical protein